MPKFFLHIKNIIFSYWHILLFATIVFIASQRSSSLKDVSSTIKNEKNIKATIQISKQEFHNYSFKKLNQIEFENPVNFNDGNVLKQNRYSAWYKMRFFEVPDSFSLDFFQYETVIGFDSTGENLISEISEFNSNEKNHSRHLVFNIPKSKSESVFIFKVFTEKCQQDDQLELRLTLSKIIEGTLFRQFYENQTTAFWFVFVFGMAFFQLLYIGSLAWSRRKPEYFYYFGFAIVGAIYILIARRFELGYLGSGKFWITSSIIVYFAILNFFYLRFVRYYLNTKTSDQFVDRQYRNGEFYLIAGTIVNALIYFFTYDLEYTFSFFKPFSNGIIVVDVYLIFFIVSIERQTCRLFNDWCSVYCNFYRH